MTALDEHKKLQKEHETIKKETELLLAREKEIIAKLIDSCKIIIKDDAMLSKINWDLLFYGQSISIVADRFKDKGCEALHKLLNASGIFESYHFAFQLADDDGEINFDDNEISIRFENIDKFTRFKQEYKINPNFDGIVKREKKVFTELKQLGELKKALGL